MGSMPGLQPLESDSRYWDTQRKPKTQGAEIHLDKKTHGETHKGKQEHKLKTKKTRITTRKLRENWKLYI